MSYDAFLSYSHAADGQLVPALQSGLQRLAKPWYRVRALRVFRDETALATNPHLWSSIQDALDDSAWLVLLASPEAAASEWVDREVRRWLGTKPFDHVLTVVTDGEWRWDANLGILTGDAVPPSLRDAVHDEPRHLDLRWARTETDLDLRNTRFRSAVADLAATIHGVPKDELESEDVRQYRRTRRLARGGFATIVVLLVLALLAGGVALVQRGRADRKAAAARREADAANAARLTSDAQRLAALARALPASQLDLALLLAVQGRHLERSDATDGALEAVLARSAPGLDQISPMGAILCGTPFSPDGRFEVTSTTDGVVHLVDTRAGTSRPVLHLSDLGSCNWVTFSSDGHRLVIAQTDGTVGMWDTATGHSLVTPLLIQKTPAELLPDAVSPRPGRVVTATADGAVIVWDTTTPDRPTQVARFSVRSNDGQRPWVWLADAANPDRVAIGVAGETQVWDIATHTLAYPPLAGQATGESADGAMLATASPTTGYRLWDVATGRQLGAPLPGVAPVPGPFNPVWFTRDGTRIAVEDVPTQSIRFFDVATRRPLPFVIPWGTNGRYDCGFLDDGRLCVVFGQTATLWRVGVTAPTPFATALGAPTGPATAFFNPEASQVLVGTANRLDAWNAVTGARTVAPPGGPYNGLSPPAYSADGKLVSSVARRSVDIFDTTSSRRVAVVGTGAPITGLAWSPQGRLLAVATATGAIGLWDLADPARPARITSMRAPQFASGVPALVQFSPDGRVLAIEHGIVLAARGAITLFDTASGRLLRTLGEEAGGAGPAVFSPDSRTVAQAVETTGSAFTRVLLRDVASGEVRARLNLPYNQPIGVAYVADGRWLAVSEQGGRSPTANLGLFNATSLVAVGEPIPVPGDAAVLHADRPGGFRLVSGTSQDNGRPIVWDLDPSHWEATACRIAGRNLTRAEWNQYLPGRPYQQTCPQWPTDPSP